MIELIRNIIFYICIIVCLFVSYETKKWDCHVTHDNAGDTIKICYKSWNPKGYW